ncbi:helix-turn-helix transcriptional regulator [Fructobacillus parabroussonetiae]|uniref:Helix-turn-helix domain-containing protein n=1 Tax=Fructobacillus parabroussonetiae TaxID=2713174 RepID=A0ABS5QVH1_9LACO|nr:helix-turn-helix domain-containing protein [Fructobacillus parabroussonetiae]MBS9337208.1 helix-turn-helix domain-containing protein [Fructobacillus parabroussonetiae]
MNRIKELRKNKHITQGELADYLGISTQAISLYERNEREPKLATWQKLADFFGVGVGYLQGLTEIRDTHKSGMGSLVSESAEEALANLSNYVNEVGTEHFREEMAINGAEADSKSLTPFVNLYQEQQKDEFEDDFSLDQHITSLSQRAGIMEIINSVFELAYLHTDNSDKALKKIRALTRAMTTNVLMAEGEPRGHGMDELAQQAKENIKILLKEN